ncbi:MAG: protein translocase SEC61 complex subunit gamma [Candidatus Woesearchaeota archaeon]
MFNLTKLKRFYKECIRVLKVTKKPTNTEFQTITKVTGLGMLVIGLIGFLIQLIFMVFRII